MWVVCGAPRSGTTAMLEALAAWTSLHVRWSVGIEWRSRRETGLNEAFWEGGLTGSTPLDDTVVVKVLDPAAPVPTIPTRVILMLRDPHECSVSARKIRQVITPEDVRTRQRAFRTRWPDRCDEVWMRELQDQPALFARLHRAGWPVTGYSPVVLTASARTMTIRSREQR